MKASRIGYLFRNTVISIFAVFYLLAASAAIADSVLRIAFPVFPPFQWVKKNGAMAGIFYEILRESLEKRMGVTVVWTPYPWPRCQENLKNGIDDAIISVPTAERAEFTVTHKTPFYQKPLNLYTYWGHSRYAEILKIRTIADIQKGGFSVITYSANGWHMENIESRGIKTFECPSVENVWKMLAGKRGDLVLEWPPGAWPDIQRAGVASMIINTGIHLTSMPFHLLIRKNASRVSILPEFDETIQAMIKDGTIAAILAKY